MGYPEEEARGALRLSLGPDDDRRRDRRRPCRGRRRASLGRRCGSGAVARSAADPLRPGRARRDAAILVAMSGGRRLVGRRGAAATSRAHEVVGVWMRLHDVADTYSEFKKSCCSLDAADDARRVAAPARHPVLRHEPRARVRRRRAPAVPRRLPRRAGRRARASTATRTSSSGRCSAGPATCTTARRSRPATTPRRRRRAATAGARACCAARDADKDQTYFLYGLRQDQLAHARFPLGELTKPEVRDVARGARPRHGRQAREPGDLLRARRRLPRRAARAGRLDAGRRARCSTRDGERVGEHARRGRATPSASGRASAWRSGEPRYVSADRPADEHDHARPARGPRDDDDRRSSGRRFVAGAPPHGRATPFRAEVRIRHRARARSPATVRPRDPASRRAAGAGSSRRTTPVWAAAPGPGRRPLRRRRRPRWRPDRPARRRRAGATAATSRASSSARRVILDPALVLAILVGHLPRLAVRADPRARPAAGCRSSCSPRSSGPGPATPWATGSGSTCFVDRRLPARRRVGAWPGSGSASRAPWRSSARRPRWRP